MSHPADFIPARDSDAKIIAALRQAIWATTYRGIYLDDVIDHFDFPWHVQRDLERIKDPSLHVYLIRCADETIGYLSFSASDPVFIHSLYLLEAYQRRGIGKQAFSLIRQYCHAQSIDKFRCNCNSHNYPAQAFYRAMGGAIVKRDEGHKNRQEDQITFEFEA